MPGRPYLREWIDLHIDPGFADFVTWMTHVHYAAEDIVGAYGIYSFVSCVVLVLAAKALRKLLKRDEEFYDADD